jgi:hypothetical protein
MRKLRDSAWPSVVLGVVLGVAAAAAVVYSFAAPFSHSN